MTKSRSLRRLIEVTSRYGWPRAGLLVALLLLAGAGASGQVAPANYAPTRYDCLTSGTTNAGAGQVPTPEDVPVPTICGTGRISFVAVHVHFIQDPTGGGNFQPVDNPTTDVDENGYRWARGLVGTMN